MVLGQGHTKGGGGSGWRALQALLSAETPQSLHVRGRAPDPYSSGSGGRNRPRPGVDGEDEYDEAAAAWAVNPAAVLPLLGLQSQAPAADGNVVVVLVSLAQPLSSSSSSSGPTARHALVLDCGDATGEEHDALLVPFATAPGLFRVLLGARAGLAGSTLTGQEAFLLVAPRTREPLVVEATAAISSTRGRHRSRSSSPHGPRHRQDRLENRENGKGTRGPFTVAELRGFCEGRMALWDAYLSKGCAIPYKEAPVAGCFYGAWCFGGRRARCQLPHPGERATFP